MKALALCTFYSMLYSIAARPSSTSQWQQRASYPGLARHHPVTFANETHGFLLTGSLFNSMGYSKGNDNAVYIYNKQEDSWSESETQFPGEARSFAYGIATDSRNAYVGFGTSKYEYLNDLWHLDMLTMEWTRLADCDGVGRRHPAMVSANGKIYVGLGDGIVDGSWQNLKDFHEYDIATDTWKQIADLPAIERHHPFYFSLNDTVYAGMGHSSNGIERDWYKLRADAYVWEKLADFESDSGTQEARVAGTQGSVPACKLGFVLSGDGDNHSYMRTGEFHVYREDDTWSALPPHPGRSRWAPGSFVIGTEVFFTSGVDRKARKVFNDLWSLDISQEDVCSS